MRYPVLILLFALGMMVIQGCDSPKPSAPKIRPVKTAILVSPAELSRRSFSGRTEASEKASLGFRVPGKVELVSVKMGEKVTTGQVLAKLDPRDYRLNVESLEHALLQAQANFKALKEGARKEDQAALESSLNAAEARFQEVSKNYERAKRLIQDRMITQANFDQTQASFQEAQSVRDAAQQNLNKSKSPRKEDVDATEAEIASLRAKLDTARAALDDTVLKAPFDGYISTRQIEPQEQVMAQKPVFTLENIAQIEIQVGIPESYIGYRSRIESIQVRIQSLNNRVYPGHFKEVGVNINPDIQTYATKVLIDNATGEILPGMTADVTFVASLKDTPYQDFFLVPIASVFEENQQKWVWIMDPATNQVQRRQVEVGAPDVAPQLIPIQGELKAGDQLVTAGVHFLQDHQTVRVLQERDEFLGRK